MTNRHGSATVEVIGDKQIKITRAFDAPAALVFRAYTEPDLVRRWWGFPEDEWQVCEIDLRVGGAWRFVNVHTNDNGSFEVGFHGEYQEINAPKRLVFTEAYEGIPNPDDSAATDELTFEEVDGVTTMTTLITHVLAEHRDMHIESGMEGGMQVSMNRMEDLVATLA